MHMDPLLPVLVGAIVAILEVGSAMRRLRQPHVIAYLAAGILLGPQGLGFFTDQATITRLGEVGVVLLLFFVGMEISIQKLLARWRIAIIGTGLQILISVGCVYILGVCLDWPLPRIVLVGFAISLSSTAVVVSMLRTWGELDTDTGRDALGILLVQDMALIPMLMVLGLLGGASHPTFHIWRQLIGGVGLVVLLAWIIRRGTLTLPFGRILRKDHELQVFAAFLFCFGFAMLTAILGLSTALGAFIGGVLVASAKETEWVHRNLEPFRVIFVAFFFVSIGMLIDMRFFIDYWWMILLLALAALATNALINATLLRLLGRPWVVSLYVGAMLSQIGEFSFVLVAIGKQLGIIAEFAYQMTIGIIALTLVVSPPWIMGMRRFHAWSTKKV